MERWKRHTAVLAAFAALTVGFGLTTAGASTNKPLTPQCHNDTRLPNNFNNGSPKGGDPNVGLKPGSPANPGGYYYLDVTACGTTVTFTLDTVGCWGFQFFDGMDHHSPQLYTVKVMDSTITYTFSHAKVGHIYAARVANLDPATVTDHSSIDSR